MAIGVLAETGVGARVPGAWEAVASVFGGVAMGVAPGPPSEAQALRAPTTTAVATRLGRRLHNWSVAVRRLGGQCDVVVSGSVTGSDGRGRLDPQTDPSDGRRDGQRSLARCHSMVARYLAKSPPGQVRRH
jgi:hypothetical protein